MNDLDKRNPERSIDVPPSHTEPPRQVKEEPQHVPPRALLSKKEIKRLEKEEKALLKKEKEEAKKRKKAEERELKKLERERKKKGKAKPDVQKDWHEAVAVANSPIPHDSDEDEKPRRIDRLNSFEEHKVSPPKENVESDEERANEDKPHVEAGSEPRSDDEERGSLSEDEQEPPSPPPSGKEEQPAVKQEIDRSRAGEEFDL